MQQLAYNPLHDRNIRGSDALTARVAVEPGEDSRSGRWTGFEKRECGVHSPAP